jgi:DNA-binding SARP family transcriptional activator
MQFRILGPLEVGGAAGPIQIDPGKPTRLLGLLLLRANTAVSADGLVDALWGEEPPASAEHAVEVYVSRLRATLGPDRIETRQRAYRLRVEPGELDLDEFRKLTGEAKDATDAGRVEDAAALFRQADALWRGPALPELADVSSARAELARIEELKLAAVEMRFDADLASGRDAELVPELERYVADEPYRERLRGQLMLALYRAGRQAEALDIYQRGRRTLSDDLGIEPGPALQDLQLQILRHDPGLAATRRPGQRTEATLGPAVSVWRGPVTAIAGVVAAAAFLILALPGILGSGPTAATPSGAAASVGESAAPIVSAASVPTSAGDPSDAPSPSVTAREAALVELVPRFVADFCRPMSPSLSGALDSVTLRCDLPIGSVADTVWYEQLSTEQGLQQVLDDVTSGHQLPRGDCASKATARGPWHVGTTFGGQRMCFNDQGEATIEWTYDTQLILARAESSSADWRALFAWWKDVAPYLR